MSIKLLPTSVNPADPSQGANGSTRLVPLTPRAITTLGGQTNLVPSAVLPSADTFTWSSSTSQGSANCIYGTPVEDSQSEETGGSVWEYVSGWAWSRPIERTAVSQYLSYAASLIGGNGRLIDVYA